MNKKQQIEEMTKIINELYWVYDTEEKDIAEALYAAGYRKGDEVKREAIKEFAKRLKSEAVESSDMYTCGMAVTVSAIEKLVKEYLGMKKTRDILEKFARYYSEVDLKRLTNILNKIAKGTALEIYGLMTGEFEPYIDGSIAKEIVERFGVEIEK